MGLKYNKSVEILKYNFYLATWTASCPQIKPSKVYSLLLILKFAFVNPKILEHPENEWKTTFSVYYKYRRFSVKGLLFEYS